TVRTFVLSLIILGWPPPHFWSLALSRARDYARASVPMLPVVAGPDATRRQIAGYSILLVALAMLPNVIALGGRFYALTAGLLGAVFLFLAIEVLRRREGRRSDRAAKRRVSFSTLYLSGLCAALLLERGFAQWVV